MHHKECFNCARYNKNNYICDYYKTKKNGNDSCGKHDYLYVFYDYDDEVSLKKEFGYKDIDVVIQKYLDGDL